jgi:hypothetical protein
MTKRATAHALQQAGVGIKDVQVIELHDCFSTNELLTYEAMGMCPSGKVRACLFGSDSRREVTSLIAVTTRTVVVGSSTRLAA